MQHSKLNDTQWKKINKMLRILSKMVRGTFIKQDSLGISYVRELKAGNEIADSEIISLIKEFEISGLPERIFCKTLKDLAFELKKFLSGTSRDVFQIKKQILNGLTGYLETVEAQIEHKVNTKGKKTKVYKTFLKSKEIKIDNANQLVDSFLSISNDFFDLLKEGKQEILSLLFSVLNLERLFVSKVDPSDPVVRSELLASIVGRDSEKIFEKEIRGIFGPNLETVLDGLASVFKPGNFPMKYDLETDLDNIYVTNRAGPNGSSALLNMGLDAVSLRKEDHLYQNVAK